MNDCYVRQITVVWTRYDGLILSLIRRTHMNRYPRYPNFSIQDSHNSFRWLMTRKKVKQLMCYAMVIILFVSKRKNKCLRGKKNLSTEQKKLTWASVSLFCFYGEQTFSLCVRNYLSVYCYIVIIYCYVKQLKLLTSGLIEGVQKEYRTVELFQIQQIIEWFVSKMRHSDVCLVSRVICYYILRIYKDQFLPQKRLRFMYANRIYRLYLIAVIKIMDKSWKGAKRGGRQTELSSPGRASASYVDISSSNVASVVLAKIDSANKSEGNVPPIVFGWRPLKTSRKVKRS